jgi:transposase
MPSPKNLTNVEVLGPQKRRRWSPQEKLAMVQQSYEPGYSVSLVARQHGVNANQLFLWRKQHQQGELTPVAVGESTVPAAQLADAMRQNDLAIQGRLAKVMDDQARGLTSPEALAKMPYEQRRAIINERDMLIKHYLGDSRKDTSDMKRTEMTLGSEMDRAKMSDATTRRGQDWDAEGTIRNLYATAQSKSADRAATIEAAKIKAGGTKDPVMLERMKGFNDALANIYATGNEPTPEMLASLKRNFGIFDDNTRTAAAGNAIP